MSSDGYRIRSGDSRDLVDVMRLEKAIPEAPHWAEGEYASIVSSDGSADALVRRCLFVAVAEERLWGFAVGKVVSGSLRLAELESVAVSVSARRMGVGRELCKAVINWCRGQGVVEMELEVRTGSGGAVALYQGLGFVVVGQRGGYYQDSREDALLMRLRLAEDK